MLFLAQNASVNERLWDFLLSGGVFMAFIAACSLVAVAVGIHRALSLRWRSIIPSLMEKELARCDQYFLQGKTRQLHAYLKRSDCTVGHIGAVALSTDYDNAEEAARAVEATAKEEMVKLENGMGVLEVVITIAPLLGLLGTVSGLVSVFATLGLEEQVSDPTAIAAGIATALNTTIAGLVVAVITVIMHSFFTRRLETTAARLEVMMTDLVHRFHKHGGPRLHGEESQPSETEEPVMDAPVNSDREVQQSGIST